MPPIMKQWFTGLMLFGCCIAAFFAMNLHTFTSTSSPYWGAQEEGHGVNPRSRKYYEYMRHHDPATGALPPNIRFRSLQYARRLPMALEGSRDINWTSRGPINKGGRSRTVAIDKLDENHILAGGVSGGMWSSYDGGTSWVKTTLPEQIHSISSVCQDTRPGHENTWYMGTGEEFYGIVSGTSFTSLFSGDGLFKSTDNGASWQPLVSTSSGTPQTVLENGSYDYIWNVIIDHTELEQDVVYAAVYNGVIRSTDGGETWEEVLGFSSSGSEFVDIMITPSGVLYATFSDNATNGGGFFRSEDGTTWTPINPVVPEIPNLRKTVMCFNPQNENEIYFLGESINNPALPIGHFFYKYTYQGGDGSTGIWENRSANLPDDPCTLFIGVDFDFGTFRSQFSFDLCIAHHPTEPNTVFIGGVNIHRSTDAFATPENTWMGGYRCNEANPIDYSYPNHHSDIHWFTFLPSNPDVMFNANDGGIYKTTNCLADSVSWIPLNNGYITTQFYTVALEQGISNSDFVMGGMQDNGTWITHSPNPLLNWKEAHADDGAYCAIPPGRDYILTSSQNGRIYKKTIDSEGNLTGTERIDPSSNNTYLFINPFLLDPTNHDDLFISAFRTIFYLPNVSSIPVTGDYFNQLPGTDWVSIDESFIPTTAGSISSLDKCLVDNSVIYYGTTQGRAYRLENCYGPEPVRTTITGDDFPSNSYVSCVNVNDYDRNEVMLTFSNYNKPSIFHTLDGGETWVDVGGNLEENPDGTGAGPAVYWAEIYPSEPQLYFVATSTGLYSTSLLDGANTVWSWEAPQVIGNTVINMIKARPSDGRIVVGAHGRGIFSGQLPPVDGVNVVEIPVNRINVRSYPNPFTDFLNFEFSLPTDAPVHIDVYNSMGQKVAHIPQQNYRAGLQRIRWSPEPGMARGNYIYVVSAKDKKFTGKFLFEP
jgi:photosystem II stability/assembly factor-like uncharacterized protein